MQDPLGAVARDALCELTAGHEGSHVAFVVAVQQGDHWWWLRWDVRHREFVRLELCDRVEEDGHDDCLLPASHPGPHSFEL
ncbi:hypothetical protein [Actinoplanes sp. NPDC026623]|uniref:hypothetical protein n=1 Tax=Actinoplanes sp. NPDC026623 TaxID=3155610 RepID=UPI0033FEFD54